VVEELTRHDGADRVTPAIVRSGRARAIAPPPGERFDTARLELGAENVVFHAAEYVSFWSAPVVGCSDRYLCAKKAAPREGGPPPSAIARIAEGFILGMGGPGVEEGT
jgi:hypothetical protein